MHMGQKSHCPVCEYRATQNSSEAVATHQKSMHRRQKFHTQSVKNQAIWKNIATGQLQPKTKILRSKYILRSQLNKIRNQKMYFPSSENDSKHTCQICGFQTFRKQMKRQLMRANNSNVCSVNINLETKVTLLYIKILYTMRGNFDVKSVNIRQLGKVTQ